MVDTKGRRSASQVRPARATRSTALAAVHLDRPLYWTAKGCNPVTSLVSDRSRRRKNRLQRARRASFQEAAGAPAHPAQATGTPSPCPLFPRFGPRVVINENGGRLKDIKRGFSSACDRANLEDVTPHVLRHTCATWLMQRGVPLWEAAGYLNMTPDTLQRVYGHHHPDFLRGAAEAFS
jgi:integrase